MLKTIEIDLTYQPFIDGPPVQADQLFQRAAASDGPTVNKWRETWIDLTRKAKERFGSFGDRSIGKLYNLNQHRPAIIIGSGPSLKDQIEALKTNLKLEKPLLTVSCLHNFGYFEDEGCHADYYLTLDSGEIIVKDIYEGRKQKPEVYWEATKGKKLLATPATTPELLDKWQGEIFLFSVMIPDAEVQNTLQGIERFTHYISPGGNALGGCLYIAKAVMGSDAIHFVGADFCFDYNNTFHSYKTSYDNPGNYTVWPDIFGIQRKTWNSYLQFKFYMDWVACTIPGKYISCSEGILGSYREGNLKQFTYMPLARALLPYIATEKMVLAKRDALTGASIEKSDLYLKEFFSNPAWDKDVTLY